MFIRLKRIWLSSKDSASVTRNIVKVLVDIQVSFGLHLNLAITEVKGPDFHHCFFFLFFPSLLKKKKFKELTSKEQDVV